MYNILFLNDWFYKNDLISEYFDFLYGNDNLVIRKTLPVKDIDSFDVFIGWGSGCLDILSNLDILNGIKIMFSPYLDYNYMILNNRKFKDNFDGNYSEMAEVPREPYADPQRNKNLFKERAIYPDSSRWYKNIFVIFGDMDRIIPLDYHLYFAEMFNGCSFHLVEGAGFAPFYGSIKQNGVTYNFAEIIKNIIKVDILNE
jgi:hypothetical protein